MFQIILVRHGQSVWNEENKFTGWTNVGLSKLGIEESHRAARLLRDSQMIPDIAYTSVLKRAIDTLAIILEDLDLKGITIRQSWRLNERHYGALQGLNKDQTAKKFGNKQVFLWRRSYDLRPPALTKGDLRHPYSDQLYKDVPKELLPNAESLKDTLDRLLPFWESELTPAIKSGKRVLVVAHGNSIRALLKIIMALSDEEIPKVEIPLGIPLQLNLDKDLKGNHVIELNDDSKIEGWKKEAFKPSADQI